MERSDKRSFRETLSVWARESLVLGLFLDPYDLIALKAIGKGYRVVRARLMGWVKWEKPATLTSVWLKVYYVAADGHENEVYSKVLTWRDSRAEFNVDVTEKFIAGGGSNMGVNFVRIEVNPAGLSPKDATLSGEVALVATVVL